MDISVIRSVITCLLTVFLLTSVAAQEAKVLSEVSVVYELSVTNSGDNANNALSGAVKNLFVKGTRVRSELVTPSFKQVLIADNRSDTTVILREIGNTKYLSFIDGKKREERNKKFQGMTFIPTDEKKTILGYECKKVLAKLKDGSQYSVFYAPSIIPSNITYEYQFQDLPGFALEYEALSEDGKSLVKYSATKISLTPVPIALFDIPKSGYRVL